MKKVYYDNMKICYIDLNYDDFWEDYGYSLKNRYGGGSVIAAAFLEKTENFYLAANPKSFENVLPEKRQFCIDLDWESRKAIREGNPIKDYIPNAETFDLFFYHASNIHINTEGLNGKQGIWTIGWKEEIHALNKHVCCFNYKYQEPRFLSGSPEHHVIHNIKIGMPLPKFQEYQKENIIFQCSRQCQVFQSIQVADICNKNGIKCYFAGPIDNNYPFLDHIDNKNTFYLGMISENIKNEFNKRAKASTILHHPSFPSPFTLGGLSSLSYGTPLIVTPVGFWPTFIENGKNGYMVFSELEFLQAWEDCKNNKVNQLDCWNACAPYSTEEVIKSFQLAFQEIIEDPNAH